MKRNPRPERVAEAPHLVRHGWAILVLGFAVLLAYSNSFRAGLTFDSTVILQDPRIHALTPHNLSLILSEGYWHNLPATGLYRPLTTFSFLLNYVAFGNGPHAASYHWVNLALHLINVMLVYALGLLIFEGRGPAFTLAALWGLHPVHTEAVTYVAGRADLLAAFGVLAGVLCYARCCQASGRRRLGWMAGLAAAQAIGIFSKESAAVLPGILLLYDWMTAQAGSWRRRVLPYAAAMVPLAAYLWLRSSLRIRLLPTYVDNPMVGASFLAGRITALKVLGKLVWLFVWPAKLSADYSYRAIPMLDWQGLGWEDVLLLLTAAMLLALTWLAVSRKRTAKALGFFTLFFWIAYLPTSNLPVVIGSIMAERFLYLPSIGLAGWAVAAAVRWRRPSGLHSPERAWWAVPAAICIAFGVRTYSRNLDWTDERSLWASAVAVSPGSARAHNNLGTALPTEPGRLPEIIAEFEAAVYIRPDFAEAHNNLGNALVHMPGRQQEAIAEFEAAVHIRPDYAEAHNNLGLALLQTPGRLPDAIGEFQAALRIQPDHAQAHYNLGNALLQMPDRLPEAIEQFEAALRNRPNFSEAHYNLGNALLRVPGRVEDAVSHYEAALRLDPDLAEGHYNLALALLQIPARLPDAVSEFKTALRLNPDFAEAHYNLAMVLRKMPGREAEASRELATALRLRPDLAH